jgi:protein-disulfide isomerase
MHRFLKLEFVALLVSGLLLVLSFNASADDEIPPVATTPQLYYPTINTVAGNLQGKITVVEFFDYRCRYCRQVFPAVQELIHTNRNVRVVYREYPILGDVSVVAARAVLAANQQGKYDALHSALMRVNHPLDQDVIFKIAQSVGINVQQLTTDMTNSKVDQQLDTSNALAQGLNISAIPTFVVAVTPDANHAGAIPGYVLLSPNLAELKDVIAQLSKQQP